jgi:hypothetical protein
MPTQNQPQPVGATASNASYQAPKSPLAETVPTSSPSPAPIQPAVVNNPAQQSPKPTLGINP